MWIARTASLDEDAPELITIDEGVRVSYGAGAVILPGVSIGAYSVVGAAALVNKDVPIDVRVAGVPAKVIKNTGVPKEWIHITDDNYETLAGTQRAIDAQVAPPVASVGGQNGSA